jgi:hypothetical protein
MIKSTPKLPVSDVKSRKIIFNNKPGYPIDQKNQIIKEF